MGRAEKRICVSDLTQILGCVNSVGFVECSSDNAGNSDLVRLHRLWDQVGFVPTVKQSLNSYSQIAVAKSSNICFTFKQGKCFCTYMFAKTGLNNNTSSLRYSKHSWVN